MLAGITWLLVFQCIGEFIVALLRIPVPGPVVGMVLLFLALRWRARNPDSLDRAAQGLLQHLSLLFVPAGVGVMLHLARLAHEWLAIAVALVISTVLAIAASATTMNWLVRRGSGTAVDAARSPPRDGT